MTSTLNLDKLTKTSHLSNILCSYANSTPFLQVIKLYHINKCLLEKVIFPRERFLFEAVTEAILYIYTGDLGKDILSERIDCKYLQVEQFFDN